MITQKELTEILHYDTLTGVFTWKKYRNAKSPAGSKAGHPDKAYIRIRVFGKLYKAHRLAFLYMTGEYPEKDVDHVNHNGLDNRWENLRLVSRPENNKNKKPGKNNTSGKTGVAWAKKAQKWVVRLGGNKGRIHIGYFDSFSEAVSAREKAEKELDYHPNHGKIESQAD
jgi:hypothetical protein